MTRRTIPGGSYVEAWPTGDYACLFASSHIQTSTGHVPIPPGSGLGPIYTRLFPGADLLIAGQDGERGNAWLWNGSTWIDKGPSYGVSPCAFRPSGALFVATAGWGGGSQGVRFITPENVVVSGDQTYYDPAIQVSEYTYEGDVTIGQGQEGGVIVSYAGMRKRLGDGLCYFVRFNRSGDRLAVAWWTPREAAAQLAWLDVSEIASLPDAPIASQQPPHIPQPIPEPVPVNTIHAPQDFADYARRRWAELNIAAKVAAMPEGSTRHELAGPASDALFQIVGEWHHGFRHTEVGLYPKTSGTNHRGFGEDIVLIKSGGSVYWKDVGGAFGSRTPSLDPGGEYQRSSEPEKFAVPPTPAGAPTIPPSNQPPSNPPSDLAKQVAALAARVAQLEQRPAFPDRIALRTDHGTNLSARDDGSVTHVANLDGWERFKVVAQ